MTCIVAILWFILSAFTFCDPFCGLSVRLRFGGSLADILRSTNLLAYPFISIKISTTSLSCSLIINVSSCSFVGRLSLRSYYVALLDLSHTKMCPIHSASLPSHRVSWLGLPICYWLQHTSLHGLSPSLSVPPQTTTKNILVVCNHLHPTCSRRFFECMLSWWIRNYIMV